ncbi:hypothetical protein HZA76_02460 [Candidatus Roizmanbacteria bacterium]|nr:hypothetical protein [Candidatus Roizmanbacteria bacterium]
MSQRRRHSKQFIGKRGGGGEREGGRVPEEKSDLLHLGFSCNLCMHHRTVLIHLNTGNTADFKSGLHPEKGDQHVKYRIIILPSATQDDIFKAVGEAHRLTVHPNSPRVDVVNVMN